MGDETHQHLPRRGATQAPAAPRSATGRARRLARTRSGGLVAGGAGGSDLSDDEWQRRFEALLDRRDRLAEERGFGEEQVERDVKAAVREVRRTRAAPG